MTIPSSFRFYHVNNGNKILLATVKDDVVEVINDGLRLQMSKSGITIAQSHFLLLQKLFKNFNDWNSKKIINYLQFTF